MPEPIPEIKLSPLEVKIRLMERGISAAALARKWGVWPENVRRVINCTPGFSQPEIRKKLARFLGVPVAAIGREATRAKKKVA